MFLVCIARLWNWSSEDTSHVLSTNEPQVLCSLSTYTEFNLYMISEKWILSNPPPPPPTHRSQMQKLIWSGWTKDHYQQLMAFQWWIRTWIQFLLCPNPVLLCVLSSIPCPATFLFLIQKPTLENILSKSQIKSNTRTLWKGEYKSLQGAQSLGKGVRRK